MPNSVKLMEQLFSRRWLKTGLLVLSLMALNDGWFRASSFYGLVCGIRLN